MANRFPTFLDLPFAEPDALEGTRAVILGASEATPYDPAEASHSAGAPAAIRAASKAFAGQVHQHDFDLGATLLPRDRDPRWLGVDAGDVATSPGDAQGNCARIRETVAQVLASGAVPIVLGGDDSVPIPVLAAYEAHGPVFVVQVDAHVDWGDAIRGERNGYGSPMRRAAEMPWVTGMLQIGIRGLGSGEGWQHDDARAWGSTLVTSREWHRRGAADVLAGVPAGARVVLAIDCDGIDPATFPAVAMPTPGGLTHEDMLDLLHGIAGRARLAGVILAEYVPDRDGPHRLCAAMAARLASVALGLVPRA